MNKKRGNKKKKTTIFMIACVGIITWFVYMNGYVHGNYYVINENGELVSERGYEHELGTIAVKDSCFWVFSLSNRFKPGSLFYRQTIFVVDENGKAVKKGKAGEGNGLEYDTSADLLKYKGRTILFDENGNETFWAPENMQIRSRGEEDANSMDIVLFNYISDDKDEEPLYGYINRFGEVVIEPQFVSARPFTREGLAAAMPIDGGVGYINCKGEFVIPPIYDLGFSFSDGVAKVIKDEKDMCIDTSGNTIFLSGDNEYMTSYSGGYYIIQNDNGKYAYKDENGSIITDFIFDYAGDFVNGLAMVEVEGKKCFIDTSGNMVIEPKFQDVSPFANNGLARAKGDNGLWGYINTKGEWAIEPKYAWAFTFESKSAVVKINEN